MLLRRFATQLDIGRNEEQGQYCTTYVILAHRK
jgi:hypothetical protein